MFSVNISYKEITRFGFMRGEQHIVGTSRENFSLARCEMAALFSELFKQGSAVPVCVVQEGNLEYPFVLVLGASPVHKLIYFTPSKEHEHTLQRSCLSHF